MPGGDRHEVLLCHVPVSDPCPERREVASEGRDPMYIASDTQVDGTAGLRLQPAFVDRSGVSCAENTSGREGSLGEGLSPGRRRTIGGMEF